MTTMLTPIFLPLEQGSQEWLDFRKNKIGGTLIASLMQVDGAKNPDIVLDELITGKVTKFSAYSMQLMEAGHEWEEEVRKALKIYQPAVIQAKEKPHFMVSLDGITEDREEVLEVKSTKVEKNLEFAALGKPTAVFNAQVQWQLLLSGAKRAKLMVVDSRNGNTYPVTIERDEDFMREAMVRADTFHEKLMKGIRPVTEIQNETMAHIAATKQTIDEYKKLIKIEEEKIKVLSEGLLEQFQANKIEGCGLKIHWQDKKGNIDYSSIPQLENVDLEKYRSKGTRFVKLTVLKKGNDDDEQLSDN